MNTKSLTSNQNKLGDWLDANTTKMIRLEVLDNNDVLEWWVTKAGPVIIIQRYKDDMGWEIYIPPSRSLDINQTLKDANAALNK